MTTLAPKYVAGFLFTEDRTHVALIRKAKPEWQAGYLNGIGGKIEDGEDAFEAMVREFREEAGATGIGWRKFAEISGDGFHVSFFAAIGNKLLRSCTEEPVDWYRVDELDREKCIPNLSWLIPLALDQTTKQVLALSK